ncbi:hypothetical protein HDE_06649 [Halotydeus destructor]|nr:hypothetical protein HDE_06649 [Halotydeus destructor]
MEKIEKCIQYFVFLDCSQLIYGVKRTRAQQATWTIFKIAYILFMVLMDIKFVYVYVYDDKDPQLSFKYGDLYKYFGGNDELIYVAGSICSSTPLVWMRIFSWTFVNQDAHKSSVQELVTILKVLSGKERPSNLGLTAKDKSKLLSTVKLFCNIGGCVSISVTLGLAFGSFIQRFRHDGFAQYPVNYMISFLLWLVYCFSLMSTQLTLIAFFYVSCKVVTLRIAHLQARIVRATWDTMQDYHILVEHEAVMRSTRSLNQYWRQFTLSLLFAYVPNMAVFLYATLFSDGVLLVKITCIGLLIEYFIIISTVCLIASEIFSQVRNLLCDK